MPRTAQCEPATASNYTPDYTPAPFITVYEWGCARFELPVVQLLAKSGRRDLNPRPPEPHSGALPGCATSRQLRCSTAWPRPFASLRVTLAGPHYKLVPPTLVTSAVSFAPFAPFESSASTWR